MVFFGVLFTCTITASFPFTVFKIPSIRSLWKDDILPLFASFHVNTSSLFLAFKPKYGFGTKFLISSSRFAMIASVGVCTRPQESWALCLHVSAHVALIPTSQSASARHMAASYNGSYSFPSFRFAKPSLIALSVTEEIQSRFSVFFAPDFFRINRAGNLIRL